MARAIFHTRQTIDGCDDVCMRNRTRQMEKTASSPKSSSPE